MSEENKNGVATERARPFPWWCPKCRKKEVRREVIAYECQLTHEGQPITVSIPDLAVPKCGNCGELVFDYEAGDQLKLAYDKKKQERRESYSP